MAPELVLVTLLVTFLVAIFQLLGAAVLFVFTIRFQNYVLLRFNTPLDPMVTRRAHIAAILSFLCGAFFAFRLISIISYGKDFIGSDWLLYDFMTGIYVYLVSHCFVAFHREIHKLSKQSGINHDISLFSTLN